MDSKTVDPINSFLTDSVSLPTPPQIVLNILECLNDPDFSMRDIADIVEQDVTLSARFLQMANSALFQQRREITTLQMALMTIGTSAARTVALAASMDTIFPKSCTYGLDSRLRKRSVINASAARLFLGHTSPKLSNEGFLAGLLGHLGMIVIDLHDNDAFQQIVDSDGYVIPDVAETELGFLPDRLTQMLLDSWNIPHVVTDALMLRTFLDGESDGSEVGCLAEALTFGHLVEQILCRSDNSQPIQELVEFTVQRFESDFDAMVEMIDQVEFAVSGMTEVFDLDVGDKVEYKERVMESIARVSDPDIIIGI